MLRRFRDRIDAGKQLARLLEEFAGRSDVLVLGLPRGGVPVAFEVAQALKAPLDVFVVRKLGVPGHEELAMGAIASGGVCVLNDEVVRILDIPSHVLSMVAAQELRELRRRERIYRGNRSLPDLHDRTVILVDDGLATGSSMRAAVSALRRLHPARIIVAVPTAASATCDTLCSEADDCVCAITPEPFDAVGVWYQDFSQTTDEEVREILERCAVNDTVPATES